MQQHGIKYFSRRHPDPGGSGYKGQNSTFKNMVMLHINVNGITNASTW